MDQLREHEDLCGRKKTPCPVCKEVHMRFLLFLSLPPSPPLSLYLSPSSSSHSITHTLIYHLVSILQEVSMLETAGHLEAFHSVDTSKIDWSKSLSSQAAVASAIPTPGSCEAQQNFSCACGANFQFQDDLQVHQVRKLFTIKFLCKSLSLSPSLPLFSSAAD